MVELLDLIEVEFSKLVDERRKSNLGKRQVVEIFSKAKFNVLRALYDKAGKEVKNNGRND